MLFLQVFQENVITKTENIIYLSYLDILLLFAFFAPIMIKGNKYFLFIKTGDF